MHVAPNLDEVISESRKAQNPEALSEAADIVKLFAEICKMDGHLIEIPNIKSLLGEPLYLATRLATNDNEPSIRYLAVDVVAKRGDKYIPVGIKDYEIENGVANGNKQRHDKFGDRETDIGKVVDRHWLVPQGLYVSQENLLKYGETLYPGDPFRGMNEVRAMPGFISSDNKGWDKPIYQHRGIAALMVAVSIVALRSIEVDSIKTVTLTPLAKLTWRHHGVRENGVFPLDSIVQRPKAMTVIRDAFNIE